MSTEAQNLSEFTKGQAYARENLLGKVFKVDLDVAQSLIDQIEGKYYGTPSFEAGVRSYCHKLYDQLGILTMNKRVETEEAFSIAGMHKKLQRAWDFAKEAHAGQLRKGGGDYFENHLVPVARSVSDFVTLHNPSMDQVITIRQVNLVCAALLHDCKEDCGVTDTTLLREFGEDVTHLVEGMTHETVGNRKERSAATQAKLINADWRVRLLKCFDIQHNAKDLAFIDPGFGTVWYKEKLDLIIAENGKFLEGIPTIVQESLRTTIGLGLQLCYANAKK
jgi:hypothetical protein